MCVGGGLIDPASEQKSKGGHTIILGRCVVQVGIYTHYLQIAQVICYVLWVDENELRADWGDRNTFFSM